MIQVINKILNTDNLLELRDILIDVKRSKDTTIIKKALELGLVSEEILEKALNHKYIRREGEKGSYRYTYEEQKEKQNEYGIIRNYAEQVLVGERQIERLSQDEELGRIAGGQRNIEATLLLRGDEITDSTQFEQIDSLVSSQEKKLELYAKETGCWYDFEDIEEDWEFCGRGEEAKVYIDKDSEGYIKKVVNYDIYSTSPLEFIDNRISLHNFLFPIANYTLLGFTKNSNGFAFILKQQFIKGTNTSVEVMSTELEKSGFLPIGGNMYMNSNYIIEDQHQRNVLTTEQGNLVFIDTVISLNEGGDGYGGHRKYNKVEIHNTDNNIEKSFDTISQLYIKGQISDEIFRTIEERYLIEKGKKANSEDKKEETTTKETYEKWL